MKLYRMSIRDFNTGLWNGKFMGYISKSNPDVKDLNVKVGDRVTNKYRSGYWLVKE